MTTRQIPLSQTVHPAVRSLVALGLCLGFLGVVLGGGFTVRRVEVVGKNLPQGAIVQASGVLGENLFTVRSDQVIVRLSAVRQIVVERVDTLFPGQVVIYAKLRTPMAAWRRGSALFLLDPDGHIIDRVQSTTLPVIAGDARAGALPASVIEAVRVARSILTPVPNGAVAAFSYGPRNGLMVHGRAGWTATVGTGSSQTLVNRIAVLAAALTKTKDGPTLKSIDLRYRVPYATTSTP